MKGILKANERLAPHTSWHIGGPADQYYRCTDIEDLSEFLATLPIEEPITWLGLGSNVLISDEGIRGTVIHTLPSQSSSKADNASSLGVQLLQSIDNKYKVVRVEAGIPCAKLAKFCVKNELMGGEFFAGIPGTIGGALAMNAGAFGGETWKHVILAEVINRRGERIFRLPSQFQVGYRLVEGPKNEWFVAGHFQFECGDPNEATAKIKALLKRRNETQPIGTFSCGSVFKNPEGHYAGQLIEASKLKGFTMGEAQISPKHANFILNLGKATASDIRKLIEHIQAVVFKDHQVILQTEVRMLGF